MFRILYEKRVFRDLDKIPDRDLVRIDRTIRLLNENPVPPGSKKLISERNLYRVRQGDYRIIYFVDHRVKEIRIMGVRHRREAYR